jgi:TPR repeat protein
MKVARIVVAGCLLLSSSLVAVASDAITQCDTLAASPADTTRPAGIDGVSLGSVDAAKAIPACLAAVTEAPKEARLHLQLGRAYEADKADDKAALAYQKAAELGSIVGMNNFGVMLDHGRGTAKDETRAVELYRKAADAGLARAQVNLGNLLRDGRGTAKDGAAAFVQFKKAADQGDAEAMYQAGLLLEYGDGIPADIKAAFTYYKASADNGDVTGTESLATLLEDGRGTAKDEKAAFAAYKSAIEGGSSWSKIALAGMLHDGRGTAVDDKTAMTLLREGFSDEQTRTDTLSNGAVYYNEVTRKAVQDMLKKAGLFNGTVDGVFGPDTNAAIEAFLKLPAPPAN